MPSVRAWLEEDTGPRGDLTTRALFGASKRPARARLFPREPIVAAGLLEAHDVFESLGVVAQTPVLEGSRVDRNATLLDLRGPLSGILTGERLALNLVGRMSGIATEARRLQDLVGRINPSCRVAATRKTTPGFRVQEKRAVALGGGDPHRYGLYDALLIKDNHLDAVGAVDVAVRRARAGSNGLPVEVEASTSADVEAAARAKADWILLDNLAPEKAKVLARLARRFHPNVRIECSGGLRPERLALYARFADRLSLGALTHSARSADVALELVRPRRRQTERPRRPRPPPTIKP